MNLAEDPRAGLELTRYHSWARHRQQSVGEHSCQIIRILLTVWPDCPRKMIVHAVTHDVGEMAGDAQYPYKKLIPGMKEAHDAAEEHVRGQMRAAIGLPPHVTLSFYERTVFKIVEFVEMWEYGLREINMGNRYARIIATRSMLEASSMLESLGEPESGCPDVRPAIKSYVDRRAKWEMTPETSSKTYHGGVQE